VTCCTFCIFELNVILLVKDAERARSDWILFIDSELECIGWFLSACLRDGYTALEAGYCRGLSCQGGTLWMVNQTQSNWYGAHLPAWTAVCCILVGGLVITRRKVIKVHEQGRENSWWVCRCTRKTTLQYRSVVPLSLAQAPTSVMTFGTIVSSTMKAAWVMRSI